MSDAAATQDEIATTCCVVGGGPAGMMLGFLLARAGVDVVVIEKHADFLRDFRGDTVHPSTLELFAELGLLDAFLALPHQEARRLKVVVGDREYDGPDFSHLPTRCKFIALMPQWDFLDFLAAQGKRFPAFHLLMQAEVHDLVEEGGRIAGVRARTPQGEVTVRADLVIAADGRHSVVRELAGMQVRDFGVPIDVLWFRLPKRADEPSAVLGRLRHGRIMITLDRGDYFQCGLIIRKGDFDAVKARGLDAFRAGIVDTAPFLRDGVAALVSWDQVKLLTVQVNRLPIWHRPGLLCIGDAAHAMSPAGGVGINLAIQDAVATANLLVDKLRRRTVTEDDLAAVQRRREMPVRLIQAGQVFIHRRMFGPHGEPFPLSWPARKLLALLLPLLRRAAARFVGIGFRPEHVGTVAIDATPEVNSRGRES